VGMERLGFVWDLEAREIEDFGGWKI